MKTAIIGKGKNKELWVNDEYFCVINDFLILKHKLPNEALSSEQLTEIKNEAEVELGFNLAVDYVAKQKTEKQVFDYLIKKISYSNAKVVLEKLRSYRYVDDVEFAKNFVEGKKSTCGKNKLKVLLFQRGVDKSTVDNVLNELDGQNSAFEVAKKYMRFKETTPQNLDKLSRYLASKGFTWEEIGRVVRSYKEKVDESWN